MIPPQPTLIFHRRKWESGTIGTNLSLFMTDALHISCGCSPFPSSILSPASLCLPPLFSPLRVSHGDGNHHVSSWPCISGAMHVPYSCPFQAGGDERSIVSRGTPPVWKLRSVSSASCFDSFVSRRSSEFGVVHFYSHECCSDVSLSGTTAWRTFYT